MKAARTLAKLCKTVTIDALRVTVVVGPIPVVPKEIDSVFFKGHCLLPRRGSKRKFFN